MQELEPISVASQGALVENWIGSEVGTATGTLIWDACAPSSGLTCCA